MAANSMKKPRHSIDLRRPATDLLDILCKPNTEIPSNNSVLPTVDNTAPDYQGTPVADRNGVGQKSDSAPLDLISNIGVIESPDAFEIPNDYQFEIMRLRRRIESLEDAVRERDARIVKGVAIIDDEITMWRTFLHAHVAETHDGITRRLSRLESVRDQMQARSSNQPVGKPFKKRWFALIPILAPLIWQLAEAFWWC